MNLSWIADVAANEEGAAATVKEAVVEEVAGFIEDAGNVAGSVVSSLPSLTTKLLLAGLAIFIGCIVLRIGRKMIPSIIRFRGQNSKQSVHQVQTLKSLVSSVFNYIVYFIIITVVLSLFGVNVSSLLAVAGVGGIAIAFGAQTLVKDIISGCFIWLEGSLAVGDIVDINGMQGEVENIAIRATTLRNFNGNIIVIPNGDIRTLTNMSRDFKRAIVDVRCPYEVSQDRIVAILKEEMDIAAREVIGLVEVPEVMSILSFETDCVLVRVAAKCPVGEHWRIERDLRLRIKARFDKEGIVMPHYVKPIVSQ